MTTRRRPRRIPSWSEMVGLPDRDLCRPWIAERRNGLVLVRW